MNLLLFLPDEIGADGIVRVEGRRAEHIFCILHAKPGDVLRAGILDGGVGSAEVIESARRYAVLKTGPFDLPPPPPRDLIPIIAMPRPQSFKKTLHFIASSGIRTAYFIGSAKVEKSYWNSDAIKPEAVREELILGLEQGGLTTLPDIRFRTSLKHFMQGDDLNELMKNRLCLIAHPRNAKICPYHIDQSCLCVIGPEGGFTDEEVQQWIEKGFESVEFGPYILRVEFALSYLCGRLLP